MMIPGRKYIHKGSKEVWIYEAKVVDGYGEYHIVCRQSDGYRKEIPFAHLVKYEALPEEVRQEGFDL